MKINNDSMSIGAGFSRVSRHEGEWSEGVVATRFGFVWFYAQGGGNTNNFSRLDFVHNGRLHIRSFDGKRYSERGLAMLAKRFAKEVAAEKVR